MTDIIENEYIEKEILSENLNNIIINESELLRKKLQNREPISSDKAINYV